MNEIWNSIPHSREGGTPVIAIHECPWEWQVTWYIANQKSPKKQSIYSSIRALSFNLAETIPIQFGPMILRPHLAASFLICASNCLPFAPISLPPAEIIITPPTPAFTHSLTTDGVLAMGTATTAKSTGSGIFLIEEWAGRPYMNLCRGLTGKIFPWYPASHTFLTMENPILPSFSLAPIIAIDSGLNILSRLWMLI